MPDNAPLTPRPIHDQILVRQDPPRDTTLGGLILTLDSRERWTEVATVVAVGPGRAEADGRRPMDPDLVPGARVLIERRPCIALELEINSPKELENLLMIEEDDVLALVDDDAGHVIQVTRGRREP